MVPIVRDFGGQGRIEKSSRELLRVVERPKKDPDEPSSKRTLAPGVVHGGKEACRQPAHTDVESLGLEDLSKCGGGAKVAPVSVPFDGHAVPAPGAHFACQDRGLMAHDPERLGKIPQVSPRL